VFHAEIKEQHIDHPSRSLSHLTFPLSRATRNRTPVAPNPTARLAQLLVLAPPESNAAHWRDSPQDHLASKIKGCHLFKVWHRRPPLATPRLQYHIVQGLFRYTGLKTSPKFFLPYVVMQPYLKLCCAFLYRGCIMCFFSQCLYIIN